ncbi:hypothetical protein [Nonomuraea sp. NPDC003804]|uniref:hypothetical protein n=1 Tax=Nonomuraea sp. NPDC003804 TaxID=3154547 RepID=UPI0033ADE96D
MTSPTNDHDPLFDNLVQKALGLTKRRSARERAIAQGVADFRVYRDEVLMQKSLDDPGEDTPREITEALRAPKGADQLVAIYHGGMLIKARLHPTGRRDPAREAAVWRCLRDTAVKIREERQ